jgi:O-acetyl-ADP-ribose deacetylase (regulator of RNase III)
MVSNEYLGGRVRIKYGNIVKFPVDAIVNAANSSLLGGGGVDGAIHDAGGPAILEACKEIRATAYPDGLPTGRAVITGAGDLPAKYVIHTVGPIFGQHKGREPRLLADCYRNSLELAAAHGVESISFPAISTGAYGYPLHEAAVVASEAISSYVAANESPRQIYLVFWSKDSMITFVVRNAFK